MGVQKNISLLKSRSEDVTENLKKLILEEKKTRELAIGTLELVKLMPGYEEALATLQERAKDDGQ
jgi:fibrillarin-like rRNA methylase|tara:strand:- start:205 stop:399 length:195 start_codon:yes stop_codon:yes gene_type:complete